MFHIRRGAYRLRFFPTSYSANLWVYPESEQLKNAFYRAFLRPADTVVDVGANIGFTTLDAAVLVPQGMVFAFEPHPRIFRYLQQNVELNGVGNVHLFNVALGSAMGRARMTSLRADDQNQIDEGGSVGVEVRALDTLLPDAGRTVALLKLDVEGFEKFVLEGARQTLGRTLCVLFESNEQRYQSMGYSTGDVLCLLVDHGLTVFKLDIDRCEFCPLPLSYRSAGNEKLFAFADLQDAGRRLAGRYRICPSST